MSARHAVVLGAGMGGLLAARVLSETYGRVTVLDRDALPDRPEGRRGVPQGRHVHGFQARGVQVLDQLFPGLIDELVRAGASRIDDLSDVHFSAAEHLLCQKPQRIAPLLFASRPYLEYCVRRRVEQLEPVTFRGRLEVSSLMHSREADGRVAVRGVRVVAPGDAVAVEEIPADLVVDATGRSSRTPLWLTELGYEPPAQERIAVRVKYASQTVRLPARPHPKRFMIEGRSLSRDLGVAVFGCEHDTWVFTVLGAERAFPAEPTRDWMLAVADEVAPEWMRAALREAEPLGPVATHQHPASIRRRYDRLSRFPEGLLVVGDAMCAFNPIYGQGMSVAAEQAVILRACIAADADQLALLFFRRSAAPVAAAWELATGTDLAYPEVEGEPTRAMRLAAKYVDRVLTVAEHDPEVARRFLSVAGLVAGRGAIFHPRVLVPVLLSTRRKPTRQPVRSPHSGRPRVDTMA